MSIIGEPDVYYDVSLTASSDSGLDLFHVTVNTRAASETRALMVAADIARLFTDGRETWWRVLPESASHVDFESDPVNVGYARFSFALRAGRHHSPAADIGISYAGFSAKAPNRSLRMTFEPDGIKRRSWRP